jgi:hypothetical protein
MNPREETDMTSSLTRLLRAAILAPAFVLAACSDDPVRVDDHDHGEEVEAVRLFVTRPGDTEYSVELEPAATPHDISIDYGDNAIRVQWLDHDGNVVGGLDQEFRLELTNLPAGYTFARTGKFTGTLNVSPSPASGTTLIDLFHEEEGHGDFSVAIRFVLPT